MAEEHAKMDATVLKAALCGHLNPQVVNGLPQGFDLASLLVLVQKIKEIAPQALKLVEDIIALFHKDKPT